MKDIDKEFQRSLNFLHWMINGYFIHCLRFSDLPSITKEWVEEHYNVKF